MTDQPQIAAVSARLATIRRCASDIESPIGEVHLCWAALHKLADQLDDGWLRSAMFAVLEDLGAAHVSANRIFTELHENVAAVTTSATERVPS